MSLYTTQVKRIFKTTKAPHRGFIVDVVEHQDYLELRVYKDNIESFSEPQKVDLASYLYILRDAIVATGTKCHIQGSIDPVPNRKWEGS